MQGITGLCAWGNHGAPALAIDDLAAAMHDTTRCQSSGGSVDGAAFAGFSLRADEGVADDGTLLLAFAGDLPYRDDLRKGVDSVSDATPTRDVLLQRYRQFGFSGLTDINGIYVVAVWDSSAQRLHIVTDRFAYRKIYYWYTPQCVVFSTECGAILAHPDCPKTVSPEALADMLAYRHVSGQDTYWPHIKLAPPGAVLTFTRDGQTSETYWQWDYRATDELDRSEDDYAAEMWDLWQTIVGVRTEPRMILPLTAGMDSRCIAATAQRCRPDGDFHGATIGPEDSLELIYARRLAKDLRLSHETCPIGPDYLLRYGAEAVRRSEGMVVNHTCWRMALEPYVEASGFDCTMNGFLGVVAKGGTLMNRYNDTSDSEAMWKTVQNVYASTTHLGEMHDLFRPAYKDLAALPIEKFARRFNEDPPSDNPFDRDAYYEFMHFECRYIAIAYEYCAPLFRIQTPMADYRFIDFCLTLPRPLRRQAYLFRKMLVTYMPEAARAPYLKTGIPPGAGPAERLARKAWGRLRHKVMPRLGFGEPPNRNVYVHYGEWLRSGSRPYVEELLAERERLSEWLDPDVIARMVQDQYESNTNRYGQVYTLLTLIEWHRQFYS